MKYIDADKLIAEIERLKDKYPSWQLKLAMDDLCGFIDSLQQEQPEVDLKEKIHRFIRAYFKNPDYDRDFIAEVDWEHSMNECARHFYSLGLNARKEE